MSAYRAPGPGYWQRDLAHGEGVTTRYLQAVFGPAFERGFAEGFARYGILLETIQTRFVGGRPYQRARAIGAPERATGLPPRWLFWLLLRVHPELRRRCRRARDVFTERPWRADRALFEREVRPARQALARRLGAVDVAALDDAALRAQVQDCTRALGQGFELHFRQAPASLVPVGDWMLRAHEWTGAPAAELARVLHADRRAETLEALDRVANAVRTNGGMQRTGDAAARLTALRAQVGPVLEEYLAEHGDRIVAGSDLDACTLHEMPELVLSSVAARLQPRACEASAHTLRERVAPAQHAGYDALLAEARVGYGLHDEDLGVLVVWPMGILRRSLLEAGGRLAARGRLNARADVFETEPTELAALLGGAGPTAAEIAGRVTERAEYERAAPPLSFGEREAPPPHTWLPAGCARILSAVQYCRSQHAPEARLPTALIEGQGVSAGCHEGRARVVAGPEDFARLQAGDVLVARLTSPAFNVVLPVVGALVTDRGGALCHAAIVAREFGIPAVVGTGDGTQRIADGARVLVDGDRGLVTVIG